MRKTISLVGLLAGLMLVLAVPAMASPYAVLFEADGGAAGGQAQQQIYGWDLEAVSKEAIPLANGVNIFGTGTNSPLDLVTHQSLGGDNVLSNGDTFTESFTVGVSNGLGPPPGYSAVGGVGYYNFPSANLFIDVAVSGAISGYNNGGTPTVANNPATITDDTYTSTFTAGSATMYVDANANQTYDLGETVVATFAFDSAGPFILTPSVFSGAAAIVDFGFEITTANASYFASAPGYGDFFALVNAGLVLTLAQGGVAIVGGELGGLTTPEPDEILIGFQETGFDAKFNVPEPASLLLLGSSLIGLAAVLRRRALKK